MSEAVPLGRNKIYNTDYQKNPVTYGDNLIEGVGFGLEMEQALLTNLFDKNWRAASTYIDTSGKSSGTTDGNFNGGISGNTGENDDSMSGEGNINGKTTPSDGMGRTPNPPTSVTPEDALIKYNGIITSIQKDSGVTPQNESNLPQQKTLPSMSEKSTKSERIFEITPGYYQPGYNTDGGGLFVYNLNVDDDPNSEKPITFDLYNEVNATGYIEFYDKDGNFITAERIEPHSHVITSVGKWFSEARELIRSIAEHGLESPITDKYNSTQKPITARAGTHTIVVTNNPNASLYAQVSNAVDDWFEAVDMLSSIKDSYEACKAFKNYTSFQNSPVDTTVNQILENVKEEVIEQITKEATEEAIKKLAEDSMKKAAKEAGKAFLNNLAKEGTQELVLNILEGIDKKKILEDALADTFLKHGGEIADETRKALAITMVSEIGKGNPGILGYNLMMTVGKGLNELSNEITEKKLENVRPMVFQVKY